LGDDEVAKEGSRRRGIESRAILLIRAVGMSGSRVFYRTFFVWPRRLIGGGATFPSTRHADDGKAHRQASTE